MVTVVGISLAWLTECAQAGDLRIPLPKRSHPTPVQQLNREGVDAIRNRQYDKARTLFYRAYLLDPDDPFTLNNLGYISELDGQVERARRFYALASQRATDAVIDLASLPREEGKPMTDVVSSVGDLPMQINRANVEAVRLLSEGRASEAEPLLQRTLASDPGNAFTLNNLGVAKEMEGEFEAALRYYTAAAGTRSGERVIVTDNPEWRGKLISEMAGDSAKRLQERMRTQVSAEAQAARLNLRGVSAINRNDWQSAAQYFRQAYTLDPNNAFSLNNAGYLAEMEGDLETAQFFYEKAQEAEHANARVGFATRRSAEGRRLFEVAESNDSQVESKFAQEREAKRRQTGPIELKRRSGQPVPPQPLIPQPTPEMPPSPKP